MERTASCLCGDLRITVEGEPARVNMCNCTECQRRSGSAFQLGAFFDEGQMKSVEGAFNVYSRTGGSGNLIDLHFCPTCGVSVFFRPQARPSILGIHGGCFADPDFPSPDTAGWIKRKHDWVVVPDGTKTFDETSK
jgi:hypothetical protein